jgi:hypothetical protein
VTRPREQASAAHRRPRTESGRRARGVVGVAVLLLLLAACSGAAGVATGDVGTAQTIVEMGEAVNALQQETAAMQAQVDSLSAVVARQDTVIRQIAGMAGVPLPVR